MIPTILKHETGYRGSFEHYWNDEIYTFNVNDFIFQGDSVSEADQTGNVTASLVYKGTDNRWYIGKAKFHHSPIHYMIVQFEHEHLQEWAFPIDPRLKKSDIEGATKIFPNSTNTGWLFLHSESDEHQDRADLLEAMMITSFQDVIDGMMQKTLAIVTTPPTNARPIIGDPGSGNAKAYYLQWNSLVEFRQECVKWLLEYEKILYIGQHLQEDDLHTHDQMIRAITQAKKVWARDKADDLSSISVEVTQVEKKINTMHTFETRWDRLARIEAEAKKAALDAVSGDDTSEQGE